MPTEGHLCFMVGYELQGDTADADTHTCHHSAVPHASMGLSELHLHSVSERSYLDFSKHSVLCWVGRAASLLAHPRAPCWLCVSMIAIRQLVFDM